MPTLTHNEIATLLDPYLFSGNALPAPLIEKLSLYLDLLLKWNSRTNLTAIRDPREIVQRHFGESLFASQQIGLPSTLLDLGSGAGFPGLPIALRHPEISVTLAESQNKKASFLREAVRTLDLPVEVWADRAETLPATRRFHAVTLRAVDDMEAALAAAQPLATDIILVLASTPPILSGSFTLAPPLPIPNSSSSNLYIASRR